MDDLILARNRGIFERAAERGAPIDRLLIEHDEGKDPNFFLVTGVEGHYLYASAAVGPDGEPTLLVAQLEENEARGTGLPFKVAGPSSAENYSSILSGAKRIGVNGEALSYGRATTLQGLGLELVDVRHEIKRARTVKTPRELEQMKKAASMTARVAAYVPKMVREGMREFELASEIDYSMGKLGSQGTSFPTLAAFGEGSADPHHMSGKRKLKPGDLVLVDFGAVSGRMKADITRTFVYGKVEEWQRRLYKMVLNAQEMALDLLDVGVPSHLVHQTAEDYITRELEGLGMGGTMGHGLGHGIGYLEHDGVRLTRKWKGDPNDPANPDFIVMDGLITTVEPGAYIPGRGGVRIEDDVYVGSSGVKILTGVAPKGRLIQIG